MQNKFTISTAESCTGGNIAHIITAVAGSSAYFKGAVVAYSNEIKIKVLNVPSADIDEFGAVSKEVVEAMASGVCKLMNTDYAIATSGIAGPDGGTELKPVGTIWIAVCNKTKVISKCLHLNGTRLENIEHTSKSTLKLLADEFCVNIEVL